MRLPFTRQCHSHLCSEDMTDYNKYLDGLMASCQRIVEQSYHQAQYIPQYLVSQSSLKVSPPVVSPPLIPENPLPTATAPSTSALVVHSPTTHLTSAQASPKPHKATSPAGQAASRQMTRKGLLQNELVQEVYMPYEELPWHTLSKELGRRGLIRDGIRAVLAKRLEKDDEFQAAPRTAMDYDKMDLKDLSSLCRRRFIPSNGTDLVLRKRLKAHDERRLVIEDVDWPGSALKVNDRGERPEEEAFPSNNDIHEACSDCRKAKVCVYLQYDQTQLNTTAALCT